MTGQAFSRLREKLNPGVPDLPDQVLEREIGLTIGQRKDGVNPYPLEGIRRKPELLAPGGSFEKARIAYLYGADAVYVGGKALNLRMRSKNLGDEDLAALAFLARRSGKGLYVTLNSLMRPRDLGPLKAALEYLRDIQAGGVIVGDPGAVLLARELAPGLPLHLSTQVSTMNHLSARFWEAEGIRRINLARELSLDEIQAIRRETSMELEVFVHGSLCVSYSGRCLLSHTMTGRSANNGHCAQPCRWTYRLVEEKRPGEYFPVGEGPDGSYILNSRDLCLIDDLPRLARAGIDALKIEGRMKGAHYVASVTRAYRRTLDACWPPTVDAGPDHTSRNDLLAVSHRPYTRAFLFPDSPQSPPEIDAETSLVQTHTLAGIVRAMPRLQGEDVDIVKPSSQAAPSWTCLEVRSQLRLGQTLHFLFPDGRTLRHPLQVMENHLGQSLATAHPNTLVRLPVPFSTFPLQVVRLSRPH